MLLQLDTLESTYLHHLKNQWLSTPTEFPLFLTPLNASKKRANESYIQTAIADFQNVVKNYSILPFKRRGWINNMKNLIRKLLLEENIIGISDTIGSQVIHSFEEEIKAFLRQVRTFSPELSFVEIGQALRNYIVYLAFKEMTLEQKSFSMPAFGYSMLYPFTDNYIDDPNHSSLEKEDYNQMIQLKLKEKDVQTTSLYQQKTCLLLDAITAQYPRSVDSTMQDLLLLILDAQKKSIQQQHAGTLQEQDCLDISVYKGSVSVLVDRLLVNNEFAEHELQFYLNFGFFLQLVDDIQDIKTDYLDGYQTLFTLNKTFLEHELLANKAFHFLHQTFHNYEAKNPTFQSFILENCYQLLFSSIHGSKEYFSPEYLSKLEPYFLISFSFHEGIMSRSPNMDSLDFNSKHLRMLDTFLADS